MRREFRERLAAALESGQFVKIVGQLCGGPHEGIPEKTLCCAMGVAGLLLGGECSKESGSWRLHFTGGDNYGQRFDATVLKKMGMTYAEQGRVVNMNDALDWSFGRIAEAVRTEPEFDERVT